MAFRKKWQYVLPFAADIMIIQECEHASKYRANELIPDHHQFLWVGDNLNKGIGVFSFNNYQIAISKHYTPEFKYIVPIEVIGKRSFHLFAVWAMPHRNRSKSYVGQIWGALNHYQSLINADTIWIGDFNSNQRWDHERKNGNHSNCVQIFNGHELYSAYHFLNKQDHGDETTPTYYLQKNLAKPYHLDYCFLGAETITEKTTIQIGSPDIWLPRSDHMPIIIKNIH